MKTQPLGPFLGINNRLPDFSLHVPKKGDYVREAVNVDLTNSGTFQVRLPTERVHSVTGAHSLFKSYLVISGSLYKITLPGYSQALVKVLSNDDPMYYVEYNGDIYASNGADTLRIDASGTVYPWALPTTSEPVVIRVAGTLDVGWYQVAVSYLNATTGEEGGVSPSQNFNLTVAGSLRVTLPSVLFGATHINVFVSTLNGSIPLLQTTAPVGTAYVDVSSIAIGRQAFQRYEAPIPAGRPFMFNGTLYTVSGSNVYEGIPYRFGYYLPAEGRVPFAAQVSNFVPAQTGAYVVADKTYFFQGVRLTKAEQVRDVLPYGGVFGTEFSYTFKNADDELVARYGWFGSQGFVTADPSGTVTPLMADTVTLTPPSHGVSTILETRGYRRVVSCGYCLNLESSAVTTYTGWDFASTSEGYGVLVDGVYSLEGDGSVNDLYVNFGSIDFGTENLKHLPYVYAGCSSDEPVELTVTTPDGVENTYVARGYDAALKIQRIDPGKGLRASWYNLKLSKFKTLASVSFAPLASQRRI